MSDTTYIAGLETEVATLRDDNAKLRTEARSWQSLVKVAARVMQQVFDAANVKGDSESVAIGELPTFVGRVIGEMQLERVRLTAQVESLRSQLAEKNRAIEGMHRQADGTLNFHQGHVPSLDRIRDSHTRMRLDDFKAWHGTEGHRPYSQGTGECCYLCAALQHAGEAIEENARLRAEALRFYLADGTFDVMGSPEEVVTRRKAAAWSIEKMHAEVARLTRELAAERAVADVGRKAGKKLMDCYGERPDRLQAFAAWCDLPESSIRLALGIEPKEAMPCE